MGPELDPFEKSIMLLVLIENSTRRKRWAEEMCGAADKNEGIVMRAIQNHLKTEEIQPIVTRVVEIIKLSNDEDKVRKNNDNL